MALNVKSIEDSERQVFQWIPSGRFVMGTNWAPLGSGPEGTPAHEVVIEKPFYLSETLVTCQHYMRFVSEAGYDGRSEADEDYLSGIDRAPPACESLPVANVSWYNAIAYCTYLSEKHKRAYRLPTEAEWEYACRAGTTTRYFFGNSPEDADRFVWHEGNSDGHIQPVRMKQPNPWGLFDMLGNLHEWCSDWFQQYSGALGGDVHRPAESKARHDDKQYKVARGGSWAGYPVPCAFRLDFWARGTASVIGFRLVLECD